MAKSPANFRLIRFLSIILLIHNRNVRIVISLLGNGVSD